MRFIRLTSPSGVATYDIATSEEPARDELYFDPIERNGLRIMGARIAVADADAVPNGRGSWTEFCRSVDRIGARIPASAWRDIPITKW